MANSHLFDFFVQLHLTERCNLHCSHCYQTGMHVDEMSVEEIRGLIREVSATLHTWKELYGVEFTPSFNVTGGEPFLRNDLLDILSEIDFSGFDMYLLSNGILVNRKKAEALFYLGVKGVQVSIEGPEKIHDTIRGKRAFSRSLNGVRCLLDAGLNVTLNVTLSSLNAEYFGDMIELATGIGAHRIGFSRLVPYGRGAAMVHNTLEREKVKKLYEEIFTRDTGSLEIVTGDPLAAQVFPAHSNKDRGDLPLGGCAAGVSGITILPDGTLVPCRRMYIPVGNIRTDSFRTVWAESGVLEALRDRSRYKGKCGNCKNWAHCRGCRAIAYAFSRARDENDFLADDPQCFITHH